MFHPDDLTLTRHSRLRRNTATAAAPAGIPEPATAAEVQAVPSPSRPAAAQPAAGAPARVEAAADALTRTGEAVSA